MTLSISLIQAKIEVVPHSAKVTHYQWHLTDHVSCYRRILVRHFSNKSKTRPCLFFVQIDMGAGLMVNDNVYAHSIEAAWPDITKFLALYYIKCQPI